MAELSRRFGPLALGIGAALLCVWVTDSSGVSHVFLILYAAVVPLAAAGYLCYKHVLRRDLRKVRECNFRVCTHCGHDLAGLRDVDRCPECGAPYTQEFLRESWNHAHGVPTRFTGENFFPLRKVPKQRPWLDILSLMLVFTLTAVLVPWLAGRVEAGMFRPLDTLWILIVPAGMVPSLFAGKERDHLAYLARHHFRHCPRCHLPLSRRQNSGICTTCRLPWDQEWLEATWREVYSSPAP